jgi:hypothetical protein
MTPEEQFQAAIEKARKEEKEKLYADLKAKEDKIKALEAANAEIKTKGANADPEKDKQLEVMSSQLIQLNAALELQTTEAKRKEAESQERERLAKLEAYKANKIAQVGAANLILELVSGTTEAEIDASIASSQAKLAEIIKAQGLTHRGDGMPPVSGAGAGGHNPGQPPVFVAGMPAEITAEWVKSLNQEDFKKYEVEIKRQIKEGAKAFFQGRSAIR